MSSWSRCKVVVKNVALFKEVCKKHALTFEESKDKTMSISGMKVFATVRDQKGGSSLHGEGYLCAKAQDQYLFVVDNDPNYSAITRRLGKNGGILMRGYTESLIRKSVKAVGGMIPSCTEQKDKSLLLRVMVP